MSTDDSTPASEIWGALCRGGLERAFDVHVYPQRVVLRNRVHPFEDVEACSPEYCVAQALHTLIGRPKGLAWVARLLWPNTTMYTPSQMLVWARVASIVRPYMNPAWDDIKPVVVDQRTSMYWDIRKSYTPYDRIRVRERDFLERMESPGVREVFRRLELPSDLDRFVPPPMAIKRWAPTWAGLRELV